MKLLHLIESGRIDSEAVGKSHNEAWRLQKPTKFDKKGDVTKIVFKTGN